MEESFKMGLHGRFPVSRFNIFYASENVVEGLSGGGSE